MRAKDLLVQLPRISSSKQRFMTQDSLYDYELYIIIIIIIRIIKFFNVA